MQTTQGPASESGRSAFFKGQWRFVRARPAKALGVMAAAGILVGTSWLAALPAASAHPHPAAFGPAVATGGTVKVPSQRAELAYWTPARLRSAKPADLIIAGARPHLGPVTGHPTGKLISVPGGLPQGHAAVPAAVPPRTGGGPALQFSYPFPYDSFTVPPNDAKAYPWAVNGKLFFTNGKGNFVCSATSVASFSGRKNENEIWTAGHCAVNGAGLKQNPPVCNHVVDSSAVFIPAYNGNSANVDPYGKFAWTGAWYTANAWKNNCDISEDEAAMIVGTSSTTGRTLGQAVGWAGFIANGPVDQQFAAFGYPAASPYDGNSMIQDLGATATQDTGAGGANPVSPIGIGNPMTDGSSGGAWEVDWSLTYPGEIDGHNDYKFVNEPFAMYSPYQDGLSNTVRCFGASSC
jgi:hypothetical protein